jgi:hypothetical protein
MGCEVGMKLGTELGVLSTRRIVTNLVEEVVPQRSAYQ